MVGQLIRQPEHPNPLVVGIFQDLQGFLLAPLPTGVPALAGVIAPLIRRTQKGHALAEALFDLPQRARRCPPRCRAGCPRDDILVIGHCREDLGHLQRVQYIRDAPQLAHLPWCMTVA
jgi:hypothetical protein